MDAAAVQLVNFDGGFSIKGALTFDTVLAAYDLSQSLFLDGRQSLEINLSEVTQGDSASLSLLARWMRLAKQHQIKLTFLNLPDAMKDLASVSGLDEFLVNHVSL